MTSISIGACAAGVGAEGFSLLHDMPRHKATASGSTLVRVTGVDFRFNDSLVSLVMTFSLMVDKSPLRELHFQNYPALLASLSARTGAGVNSQ